MGLAVELLSLLEVVLSFFDLFLDIVDSLVHRHQLISLHDSVLALLKVRVRVLYLGLEALQISLLLGDRRIHLKGA